MRNRTWDWRPSADQLRPALVVDDGAHPWTFRSTVTPGPSAKRTHQSWERHCLGRAADANGETDAATLVVTGWSSERLLGANTR
jgi:hypothetical protein